MTKPKLQYGNQEHMTEIDPGEELEVDLMGGTQALPDEYAERIEYLKAHLWDVLGRLTQHYPRWDEWDEDKLKEFRNWSAWAWHYRNEIRLLTYLARGDVDVSETLASWPLCTDKAFGPLPEKQALVH